MRKLIYFSTVVLAVMLLSSYLLAGSACNKEEVVNAVDEAVAVLESEGSAGLEKVGNIRFICSFVEST